MDYTKEQFIKHLKLNDIVSIFEAFKDEHKLPDLGLNLALHYFGDFLHDLQQYYMRKFEVNVLYDKDHQLIKILD